VDSQPKKRIKHHVMKKYGGVEVSVHLGTRRRPVVSFTSQPLYPTVPIVGGLHSRSGRYGQYNLTD
jgi:hypothetical protein